eukprot:UN00771
MFFSQVAEMSFPTSIYLQKSALIQPRTSPSKFGGNYSILFIRVLRNFTRLLRESFTCQITFFLLLLTNGRII